MCCFSGPARVADTRIFARREGDRQVIVYQMKFGSRQDLAMVLPLPVPIAVGEHAVEFVSLEQYPRFFDDLDRAFPRPVTRGRSRGGDMLGSRSLGAKRLEVHEVGAFEASFVPSLPDFERLDRRLRVSDELIAGAFGEKYAEWGFAVFKLRATEPSDLLGRGRDGKVHPMAFTFPTKLPAGQTFLPTVHVHDGGTMPETARFDHALYLQCGGRRRPGPATSDAPRLSGDGWRESEAHLGRYVDEELAGALVEPGLVAWKMEIRGNARNDDTLVLA